MTKAQQVATRTLRSAQEDYLRAYGWTYVTAYKLWLHTKLPEAGSVCLADALQLTRANPMLGWP